ncbi:hypothetical protein CH253_08325 [Rhodococcus sp. 06-156-3C]|uniref:single-stranded DNA-binding protein n=1 Tax=Rhodococcus sp. 06-156-3C TaxID=2022486 RepID=UPI000B9BA5C4|nr:single-stranded DNA-binding protein [Rhodococcus sp. 06-156-3C]OZD23852.1 hypothetical protein CH253_08325 [Rhodococcus sp. 06-156-3C]
MALPVTTGRGFVISAPELSFLANGQAVANFPVAFKDRKKNGDEWEDIRNTVYRMTAWGKQAEVIADTVENLTEVEISFKAYEDEYQDKNSGETRKSLKATVVSCSPSIPKRDDNGGGNGGGNRGGGRSSGGGSRGGSFGSNPASQNPSDEWNV